jgi:hypothetical protein
MHVEKEASPTRSQYSEIHPQIDMREDYRSRGTPNSAGTLRILFYPSFGKCLLLPHIWILHIFDASAAVIRFHIQFYMHAACTPWYPYHSFHLAFRVERPLSISHRPLM